MEMAEKEAPKPEKMSSGDRFIKDIYLEWQGMGKVGQKISWKLSDEIASKQ